MEEQINFTTYIQKLNAGDFDNPDVETQIEAGWYDWFCKDSSLIHNLNKLKPYINQVYIILQSLNRQDVHPDNTYIFLKNNCPMNGELYNDFRICDLKSGDVILTITPKCGHENTKNQSSIWGKFNNFEKELAQGTWNDIVIFLNSLKYKGN